MIFFADFIFKTKTNDKVMRIGISETNVANQKDSNNEDIIIVWIANWLKYIAMKKRKAESAIVRCGLLKEIDA